MDTAQRLAKFLRVTESCILWTGTKFKGYGRTNINGKNVVIHRYFYELHKGPIPEGLTIDHLCRVRCCVNPEHLEAVTGKENTLRGFGVTAQNARKTHCPKGHLYDEANTRYAREGRRFCRRCRREKARLDKQLAREAKQ